MLRFQGAVLEHRPVSRAAGGEWDHPTVTPWGGCSCLSKGNSHIYPLPQTIDKGRWRG